MTEPSNAPRSSGTTTLDGGAFGLGAFFVLAFPVPGDPDADLVEELQGEEHDDLGDDFGGGEDGAEDQVDDDHVAAAGFQDAIVQHADLDQGKNDDRHLEARAHAEHEFANEADVIIGLPLKSREAEPLG